MRIGGQAGQGMNTLAHLLNQVFKNLNLYQFTTKDYMSRVRGGHNFTDIRFGDQKISAPCSKVDILIALDETTYQYHQEFLKPLGVVINDQEDFIAENSLNLPLKEQAKKIGEQRVAGIIALGALLRILNLDLELLEKELTKKFKGKTLMQNIAAAQWGYQHSKNIFTIPLGQAQNTILLSGSTAMALGALAAGIRFFSAYPMTPSTGIMNFLAQKQHDYDLILEQAEDEIAAINMALGASFGGLRSMTASSGGGFSLMVEALGLAGITETAIVIAEMQRPGPATGLPTRTEQSDLNFVINASQGEFPRIVIAPRNQEQAFYQTARAFNLADIYQLPVIILGDQYLADSQKTVDQNLTMPQIKRGETYLDWNYQDGYQRYQYTASGISPFLIPGAKNQVVLADSDEHNERGNIIEDATTRKKMVEKRMRKLKTFLAKDVELPLYHGPNTIDYLLCTWGSNYDLVEEVRGSFTDSKYKLGHLSFQDLWPLPGGKWRSLLQNSKPIFIENNYTGQLPQLLKSQGLVFNEKRINKYDGRPFNVNELTDILTEELSKDDY